MRDVLTQMQHFERVWKDGRTSFLSEDQHDETEVARPKRISKGTCRRTEEELIDQIDKRETP